MGTDVLGAGQAAASLEQIELVCGSPFGYDDISALTERHLSLDQAFEEVLVEVLQKAPCVFSFSGGRDSSALIALAVEVARKHGLMLPIPVTLVFPDVPESDEYEWQRHVLDHLGLLTDWQRLEFRDELDAVGPEASELLLRHGLVWPWNLHFHLPIVKLASGGSLVTGFGGDEVAAAASVCYAERVLAARRLPRPHDAAALALWLAPRPVRYGAYFLRSQPKWKPRSWLTRRAMLTARHLDAVECAGQPRGFGRLIREDFWRLRDIRVCRHNFKMVGDTFGVRVVHPLIEPPVLNAYATRWSFAGPRRRAEFVQSLAGKLLPDRVVQRVSKAEFSGAILTRRARQFAANWAGVGFDDDLVDGARLQEEWLAARPSPFSIPLLQAAWLADTHASVA